MFDSVKKEKIDFYNLGRHKVIECNKENHREFRLVLVPELGSPVKRICMLRDSWYVTAK